MPLYHFDVHSEEGIIGTDSHSFRSDSEAREHAVHLASGYADNRRATNADGDAIVIDAYTADRGIVLTVRLVVSIERSGPRAS